MPILVEKPALLEAMLRGRSLALLTSFGLGSQKIYQLLSQLNDSSAKSSLTNYISTTSGKVVTTMVYLTIDGV